MAVETNRAGPAAAVESLQVVGRGSQRRWLKELGFWTALITALVFFLFPMYWLAVTSLKPKAIVEAQPPTFIPWVDFTPTFDNYVDVFFEDPPGVGISGRTADAPRERSEFPSHLFASVGITAFVTLAAVFAGTLAAYSFSRFRIRGEDDMMFFILSTRMLPAVVILIPVFLMFNQPGDLLNDFLGGVPIGFIQDLGDRLGDFSLRNSFLGISLLYITVGLPFVVWMMKGFFDEIPTEYEEAAMIDGHSRIKAIRKIVLPEAVPAMLATSVFVIIVSWNEFVFAQLLNRDAWTTVPPFLQEIIGFGSGQIEWGRAAATSLLFILPIALFTYAARNHLLRGVTFGAVRR